MQFRDFLFFDLVQKCVLKQFVSCLPTLLSFEQQNMTFDSGCHTWEMSNGDCRTPFLMVVEKRLFPFAGSFGQGLRKKNEEFDEEKVF